MFSDNIFLLSPICKALIWGGTKLADEFNKSCSDFTYGEGRIGESWELVSYKDDVSQVADGKFAGQPITRVISGEVPVILKYIDAAEPLSVQVHPNKTEMWYVIAAEPDAQIIYGLKKSFNEEEFRRCLDNGDIFELLNSVNVRAGDVYFIPSGLVHSLGGGILVAEIQEASTETYRVYDYNRKHNGISRELHIDSAMEVIRNYSDNELDALRFSKGPESKDILADCEYFKVYKYSKESGPMNIYALEGRNACVMCCEGSGKLCGSPLRKGDTALICSSHNEITLEGDLEALICVFNFRN